MRGKLLIVVTLVVVLVLAFAGVAGAAVSQETIDAILADAADGIIDGNWTLEEILAAVNYVRNHPEKKQYSEVLGELEDYLAELRAAADQDGELAFTGAPLLVLLAGGAGLAGAGLLLRRRAA
jgi:hypothetical protein